MYKIDTLESINLILKPYSTNDCEYVCKVHAQNDYFIWDDLDNPKNSNNFIDKMNQFLNTNSFGWVCWLKAYNIRVGILYFTNVLPELSAMVHPISDRDGYRNYLKSCNGNVRIKIMQEAVMISSKYAFSFFNLLRITGGFFDYNFPAINLCKSVGFKDEGVIRNGTRHNGKIVNIKLLGLLKDEINECSCS